MTIIPIESKDDPRLEIYQNMRDRILVREQGFFIAEGENIVLRLLHSSYQVSSIFIAENRLSRLAPYLSDDVVCYTAPEKLINQIAGFKFNRGIIACGVRRPLPSIKDITLNSKGPLTIVICAGVFEAENLGLILRTCAALGVDTVLLGDRALDPFYRRVVRVSTGAVFSLNLAQSDDLSTDLIWLKDRGVELYATVLAEDAVPLQQIKIKKRTGLLLGNEGQGLRTDLIKLCQQRITMPMHGGMDSLNVAMAAAIFIYHFRRNFR